MQLYPYIYFFVLLCLVFTLVCKSGSSFRREITSNKRLCTQEYFLVASFELEVLKRRNNLVVAGDYSIPALIEENHPVPSNKASI